MENILKVNNLSKTYHTLKEEIFAVDNFSCTLKDGEYVSIVGPSGCGKSTILSILCELEKPSGGIFNFKGNKTVGYMLQQDCLFDWLTILDNCLLGLKVKKMLNKDSKEYVIKLLNTYGLKDFINSYPSSLSGGMRQRVG